MPSALYFIQIASNPHHSLWYNKCPNRQFLDKKSWLREVKGLGWGHATRCGDKQTKRGPFAVPRTHVLFSNTTSHMWPAHQLKRSLLSTFETSRRS